MLSLLATSFLVASQVTPTDIERGFAHDVTTLGPSGGSIIFQLFVSPGGSVEECTPVYTNWTAAAANRACDRLVGKKVSQVAKSGDGRAVHGTVLFSMIARSGDRSQASPFARTPDLIVSVQNLPKQNPGKLTINTLVLVDSQGATVECSAGDEEARADFLAVACEQLKQVRPLIRRDSNGNPVPYVTDLTVEFVAAPG